MQLALQSIHLWLANLKADAEDLAFWYSLLSHEEKERAERFCFIPHKHAYIASRGQLRQILSQYLEGDMNAIHFAYTEHQKPYLEGAAQELQFNISHSHERIYIAVASKQQIGIDTEYVKTKDISALSQRYFSQEEQAYLASLQGQEKVQAFYRIWVGKEALLKAIGIGLRIPLDSFSIPALHNQFTLDLLNKTWFMSLMQLEANYPLALATDQAITHVDCWQWVNQEKSYLQRLTQ